MEPRTRLVRIARDGGASSGYTEQLLAKVEAAAVKDALERVRARVEMRAFALGWSGYTLRHILAAIDEEDR